MPSGPLAPHFTTQSLISNTSTRFTRLPFELQIEIFTQCLPEYPQLLWEYDAPHVLIQVCRLWRNLIISSPRLWTTMRIDLGDGRIPFKKERVLSTLSFWLSRSRTLPLSIKLAYYPAGAIIQRESDCVAEAVLVLLLSVSKRWKRIHFIVPSHSLLPLAVGSVIYDFPLLTSMNFEVKGQSDAHTVVPFDVRALSIKWAHLTVIQVWMEYNSLLTLDDWAHLISDTTAVTRCSFNAKCLWTEPRSDSSAFEISPQSLRHLDIVFQGDTDVLAPEQAVASFMGRLDIPTLENCRLAWQVRQNEFGGPEFLHSSLLHFLRRHQRSIEIFSLAYFPLHEDRIIECLTVLSCLTELNLKASLDDDMQGSISDWTLQNLTTSRQGLLLPKLEHLHIQCRGDTLSATCLANLLTSRRGTFLREISLLLLEGSNVSLGQVAEREQEDIRVTVDFVTTR